MRYLTVFGAKELVEQLRTYKTLVVLAVLLLFGMISPITAKFLPEIIEAASPDLPLRLPTPTYLDAYAQFFKNVPQFGVVVLLLVFSTTVSGELGRGTLINVLAKGLPRHVVIVGKYLTGLLLWTVGYALAAAVAYGYTVYLFGHPAVPHLVTALAGVWLFGAFVLAITVLGSTLVRSSHGGLLVSGGIVAVMLVMGLFPRLAEVNPMALSSDTMGLITGDVAPRHLWGPVWITLVALAASLALSVAVFERKEL